MGKRKEHIWIDIPDSEIDGKFSYVGREGLSALKGIDEILIAAGAKRGHWGSKWYYSLDKNDPSHTTIAFLSGCHINEKGEWTRTNEKANSFRITNKFGNSSQAIETRQKILASNPRLDKHFHYLPRSEEHGWADKSLIFTYSPFLNEKDIYEAFKTILTVTAKADFKRIELKPRLADEINLVSVENQIKQELEPLIQENRKETISSLFRDLLSVTHKAVAKQISTTTYERDARLSLILKEKYDYTCQACGIKILLPHNEKYLESHHIMPLSEGGFDSLKNMIAICPNCHIKLHKGALTWDFTKRKIKDNVLNTETDLRINEHL